MANKDFSTQIDDLLNEYSKEVREEINKTTKERTFASANIVKQKINTAGIKGKRYKNSIAGRTDKEGTGLKGTVYAKAPHFRLTHLLEKGHVIRNQYGTYGRTKARPHWEPAEKEITKKYEEEVKRAINKVSR